MENHFWQRSFCLRDPQPQLEKRLQSSGTSPCLSAGKVGDWYFYEANSGLQNQPVLYRQQGLEGAADTVLIPMPGVPTGPKY